MRRQRWIMLAVAVGFGLVGVFASRLIGEHQSRSVEAVRVDWVWAAELPHRARR